ncbi:hypothetical protein HPP92_028032, partial [Vanilla planifolia]
MFALHCSVLDQVVCIQLHHHRAWMVPILHRLYLIEPLLCRTTLDLIKAPLGMHDTFMQHILLKDDKSDTNEEVTPIYPNFMKPTVIGMPQKNDLVHKSTNKKCLANGNSCPSTLRLTIPREPVLETARRAKYFRAQRSKHPEGNVANVTNFRALPLNRKILEAPSLHFPKKSTPQLPEFKEFKLKTLQRAIQRSTSAKTQLSVNNLHPSSTIKGCWTGSKILNDQPSSSTHQT